MAFRKALKRITTPVAVLDQERLRDFCSGRPGVTPIGEARPRQEVTITGEITSLRIVPRPDGTSWLEATVSDGSAALSVMWTGRTRIAGVKPGTRLALSGRGAPIGPGRRLRLTNPSYQLL